MLQQCYEALANPKLNATMASSTFELVSLLVLLNFLNFAITQAQDPTFNFEVCSQNKTAANSAFQTDLKTLFSSLASNATANTEFYNTTVTGRNSSDSVYGLFMCRGDLPSCGQCVVNATQRLSSDSDCALSKGGVIWYDECMVRYSDNRSMFSTVATRPGAYLLNTANISNQASFMQLLFQTMNETADEAARFPVLAKKYATKQATISGFQTLFCLAQCTEDLSPQNCRSCLTEAISELPACCEGKQGGRVLFPSCNVRYELYPFYRSVAPGPPGLVPGTNTSDVDSRYSEDPFYLYHNCSTKETFTVNSDFQYLRTLLYYLSSNATSGRELSFTDTVEERVHGLFMCRGDLSQGLCGQCVMNATTRISSECGFSKEAVIWYSHCMLRYSIRNFISTVDTTPMFRMLNITNSTQEQSFTSALAITLARLGNDTGNINERYLAKPSKLNDLQTLYALAQCTRDLSTNDCRICLSDVIGSAIPWAHLGSVGGRVLYPSCNLRFELFQFYRDGDEAQPPKPGSSSPSVPTTEKEKHRFRTTTLIVVFSCVSGILLFFVCYYLFRRKARRNYQTILKEKFGDESATLEPLQFEMAVIKAATNNFCHENRIGRGGFGEVYKGILLNRQQIAVKRLSKSSKQGEDEFKNEVLLIAKLQHRNLVAFIGFCLEEEEKILIYEYVSNKSLDYFLFDIERQKLLQWFDRYNIIGGIAQGILYLHEHSRLKVIHRDLKPSNILLDENMIPKISDFGLARIFEINQDQGSTNRIVGTFGYMSPEYAMLGQFSEKSDVYSFGIMVLEIITGKKNICSNEAQYVFDNLLSHVWRYWRNQTPLSILDENIKENYCEVEVIKCIQIGLLCVQHNPDERPTMTSVVSYLANHSIELPTPHEPAFFLHRKIDPKSMEESSSSRSVNTSRPSSTNEMSVSTFIPR